MLKNHNEAVRTADRLVRKYGTRDADQLADTTMDPRTRMLRRIRMEDAEQASQIFSLLMGDDVPPRKAFIVENADDFDRSKIDT